jgi:hypothetical protein
MSEVLVEFDTVVTARDSTRWLPRACGRQGDGMDAHMWEGWIEFLSMDETEENIRTGRETVQPNRADLMYWAQGLTAVYLEGALERALSPRPAPVERTVDTAPHFDGPARRAPAGYVRRVMPRPVLNPFEVYEQGQDTLVQELTALHTGRLRDIVVAYGFATPEIADGAGRERLTSLIVAGVRQPLGESPTQEETRPQG